MFGAFEGAGVPAVHFGDALRIVQDNLDAKNYYAFNPAIDIRPPEARRTARVPRPEPARPAAAGEKKPGARV